MNDIPERSQFESRLPTDRSYWHDLAARIVDSAEPILSQRPEMRAWWDVFARWSPAIGVAAAAAAIVVGVLGPPAPVSPSPVLFEQLLSPEDPVAQAVAGGGAIADISTLLLVESGGEP